jgi:predicted amidophosphoribosyltransferase
VVVHHWAAGGLCGRGGGRARGKLGEVMRALLDLLLPRDCGGCGVPGPLLCSECEALLAAPRRVYPPCCAAGPPVYALGSYRGRLRAALLAYKERGRRDLAAPLGSALASALLHLCHRAPGFDGVCLPPESGGVCLPPESGGVCLPLESGGVCLPLESGGVCLVPVPSRRAAAARRGGQHVELLAVRAAAALAGAGVATAVAPALRVASGVRDSVGLGPAARQANLAGRVSARRAGLPPAGTPVVLVDDVVTTGATVAECTTELLQAGVKVPAIVVIAAAGSNAPSSSPGSDTNDSVDPGTRGAKLWRERPERTTVRASASLPLPLQKEVSQP